MSEINASSSKFNMTQNVSNVWEVPTPRLEDDDHEPFEATMDVEPISQHNDPSGFTEHSHSYNTPRKTTNAENNDKNKDPNESHDINAHSIKKAETSKRAVADDMKHNANTSKAEKGKLGPTKTLVRDREIEDPEEIKKLAASMNAHLPRPEWYTSGEDEAEAIDFKDAGELSDFKAEQPEHGFFLWPIITCAVGFIFCFIATCPIPWIRGYDGRRYNIWYADGANQPRLRTNHIFGCTNEMQYWQVLCAISILATFAACGSLISVILLFCKHGHLGASLILVFYSFVFTLMAWAVVVALFHYRRCDRPAFASGIAHLDGGFALMFLAWCIYAFTLALLVFYLARFYTQSIHTGTTKPYRFVHVVLLCVALLFYCVGPALPVWSRSFNDVTARVSLWSVEVYDKQYDRYTFITRRAYLCTTITRRMKVVAAFDIMTIIWLFLALLCAIAACYHETKRKWSRFFTWLGVIFGFIAWLILAITRHSHLCTGSANPSQSSWVALGYNGIPTGVNNAQIRFDGYGLRAGFALIVVAWCINLIAAALNQYF